MALTFLDLLEAHDGGEVAAINKSLITIVDIDPQQRSHETFRDGARPEMGRRFGAWWPLLRIESLNLGIVLRAEILEGYFTYCGVHRETIEFDLVDQLLTDLEPGRSSCSCTIWRDSARRFQARGRRLGMACRRILQCERNAHRRTGTGHD